MKAIRYLSLLFAALVLAACSDDENTINGNHNFVRLSLLVNGNNEILEFPQTNYSTVEQNNYTHTSLKTIKIPVMVAAPLSDEPVTVSYSVTSEGSYTDFSASPANAITLPPGKLVDTIRIAFNSRWTDADANKIRVRITGTSRPDLSIGWNNAYRKMDEVTITLGDLQKTNYYFNQNLYNIQGNVGETLTIPVRFSQPITNASVGDFEFITASFATISACDGEGAAFDYTLQAQPFTDGATQINYTLTILEQTPFASNLQLKLNEGINGFLPQGIIATQIAKPANETRSGNPAANFYNVNDVLYRTYGKAWYFDPVEGTCRWSTFNTMTKPVAVQPGSAYDNGNGFHRYKIGFLSNNLPIGTNPFDLRRYYDGFSVNSPGYNITEALEFFPENGNSTTKGIVKVVAQTLSFIKTAGGATVLIPICGSGTYEYNPAKGRWEMYIELHCDETELNGTADVVRPMYIYSNNSNFTNPEPLDLPCPARLTL